MSCTQDLCLKADRPHFGLLFQFEHIYVPLSNYSAFILDMYLKGQVTHYNNCVKDGEQSLDEISKYVLLFFKQISNVGKSSRT